MNNNLFQTNTEKPVRIAQVVGKMVGGGLEATVMNYYRHLDHSKVQYDFLVDNDSTYIPDEIEQLGGRVIMVPPYQNQAAYQKTLQRIFRENRYPMVYSHLNTLSVFPLFAAWRAKVPIRIAHNHSTACRNEYKKTLMKNLLRPFAKVFPTHLCACSRFAGNYLFGKRAVESGKVTIWQNAVELDRFLYNESDREETRRKLGIENRFVVGHVGRFIHQKNHAFVVDVFREVHLRNPDSVLLLAGTGSLMPEIKKRVHAYGLDDVVIFAGNQPCIERFYSAMDVFLMPSFYEGLGMVAVEAQISGLPVIGADTIPVEAKFCDLLHYLSLKDSASKWADEVLKHGSGYIRNDMRQSAADAGYDIAQASEKMTKWYCDLLSIHH